MYSYSEENAKLYSQLGVTGTTYEVSFNEVIRLFGSLQGKTILDFGTGSGRSARLLKSLHAKKVVGIDHNGEMIRQAKLNADPSSEFILMQDTIPSKNNFFDDCLCAHVLVEMTKKEEMVKAGKDIYRVLKPGGRLIVVTTNPNSIGNDYVSYRYLKKENLKSGDKIKCLIKGDKPFKIDDVYWTEADYKEILEKAGFRVKKITYPLAQPNGWKDEAKVAPDMVILAVKSKN